MTVNDLVIQLSYKIGDPQLDGGDGEVYTSKLKINYIESAYNKLMRTLPMLMRKYSPRFTKNIFIHSTNIDSDVFNIVVGNKTQWIEKIYDMFVVFDDGGHASKKVKATYKEPTEYLSIKNNASPIVASYEDSNIIYTIINNKVRLLPAYSEKTPYKSVDLLFNINTKQGFKSDDVISIPPEYVDLLIAIASSEAMQDIGRQDKVALYNAEVSFYYNILSSYSQLKEKYEGSDVNG